MQIDYVTEEEFSKSNAKVLFSDDLYAQVFGMCKFNDKLYKFSWLSSLIKPNIFELNKSIFFIGVDLTLIIYDFELDRHLLQHVLHSYYNKMQIVSEKLLIFCETEYFIIDLNAYNIIKTGDFPDVFVDCEITGDKVKVECMCGYHLEIHIP